MLANSIAANRARAAARRTTREALDNALAAAKPDADGYVTAEAWDALVAAQDAHRRAVAGE